MTLVRPKFSFRYCGGWYKFEQNKQYKAQHYAYRNGEEWDVWCDGCWHTFQKNQFNYYFSLF